MTNYEVETPEAASANAESLAMFFRAPVCEQGTAADGGNGTAVDYDPSPWFPDRPWRTAGAPGGLDRDDEKRMGRYSRDELPPLLETLGFDEGTLSYCYDCETRYGCAHNHAPDVRVVAGLGPVVDR